MEMYDFVKNTQPWHLTIEDVLNWKPGDIIDCCFGLVVIKPFFWKLDPYKRQF